MPFSTLNKTLFRRPKDYPHEPKTVGEHLLKVRLDRKLTKVAVAKQIGVAISTFTAWEQDKFIPEATHMKGIIAFFGYYPFPEPVTLPERIRKYRNVHGLTLEQFGDLLDVSEATVWTWENEKYTPAEITVRKINDLINHKELS